MGVREILKVSATTYAEISEKLQAAGYHNEFGLDREILDMNGIAITRAEPATFGHPDEHEFSGDGYDCVLCGAGRQHYIHTDRDKEHDDG